MSLIFAAARSQVRLQGRAASQAQRQRIPNQVTQLQLHLPLHQQYRGLLLPPHLFHLLPAKQPQGHPANPVHLAHQARAAPDGSRT